MSTRTPERNHEIAGELRELQAQMLECLDQAQRLIRQADQDMTLQRAEAYWLAHARIALTNSHGYLGGSMCSMEDTIEEIAGSEDEEDEGD